MNLAKPVKTSMEQGIYLYGVVAASAGELQLDLESMNSDGRVETRRAGDLVAVCERMPLAPWTGSESAKNLQTLQWVAPRAVHHETINEAVGRHTPVFPMTFGTLFSSEEAMVEHLDARADELESYFDLVEGRSEWSVKGLLDRKAARRFLAESEQSEPTGGLDYLKKRKKQAETSLEIEPWLEDLGHALFDQLAGLTVAHTVIDSRGRSTVDDGRTVVFNWAFLVDDDSFEALDEFIDAWNADHEDTGLALAMSGPWPAYSFRSSTDADR